MQLIGMLDSPYVRRVAISLRFLGIPFDHQPVSVFRHFDRFQEINPVVKAPTLVCADGEVLMDSSLILEYAEAVAAPEKSLSAGGLRECQHALRMIGLALAACEKTVQIIYEKTLRPAEKQHEPWLARIQGQLAAAYAELEREMSRTPLASTDHAMTQAGITAAVAWRFTEMNIPGSVKAADHPALVAWSVYAEQLPEFLAMPPT